EIQRHGVRQEERSNLSQRLAPVIFPFPSPSPRLRVSVVKDPVPFALSPEGFPQAGHFATKSRSPLPGPSTGPVAAVPAVEGSVQVALHVVQIAAAPVVFTLAEVAV